MKFKAAQIVSVMILGCMSTTLAAEPIDVAGEVFELGNHAFPVKVETIGYQVTANSITDSDTYLEGADLTGWRYAMTRETQLKFYFQAPIEDQAGDDIYFGQGRMQETSPPSGDRHALEFSFDGETWHYLGHADFTKASDYWYRPRTTLNWYYQLYRSSINLSDYAITGPVTELYVRGVEYLNLVLVGNLNTGTEIDDFPPFSLVFPEAVSFTKNGKKHYNKWYKATIFAHDAADIKVNVLKRRINNSSWRKVDSSSNLTNTIGGTYGGHYRLAYNYAAQAPGDILRFRNIVEDKNGKRTVVRTKARVKRNGGLRFFN